MSEDGAKPVMRVISGSPTPEELAVVTALVAASGSGSDQVDAPVRRGRWNDPKWAHRGRWLSGPNAWRSADR